MMRYKWIIIFGIFSLTYSSISAQDAVKNALEVSNNIQYSEFYKHLEYLSSDELKGRDTGSEGYAMAADYVANEFEKNGLIPLGDNNTYFQKVSITKKTIIQSSIKVEVNLNGEKVEGKYGENISILLNPNYNKINHEEELVFVGYGNILPEYNINDYEGVNVKGKIVIVTMGVPKGIDSKGASDPFIKVKNAIKNEASGIILFMPNKLIQGLAFKQLHSYIGAPTISLSDTSMSKSMIDIDMEIGAFSKKELIDDIFKLNGLKLKKELKRIKKGNFVSKELESKLRLSYSIKVENSDCKNVVAMIPGTDTTLMNEYVVLGGHLDHLGIGTEVKGDSIYNGMWDNASGSAAIINIAKAYTELSEKPKRSVVFICYTGEEKGLLGSSYYAKKNNLTNGKIVANLNIDMLGNLFKTTDVIPMGYSHSNLSEAVDFATGFLNVKIDDNKQEEQIYLERSDQISFIQNKIPALNIGSGYTAVNPKIDGQKYIDKWLKKTYHSPFDDLKQDISDNSFLTYIRINFLTAFYITNMMDEVKWNQDSWLYKKYVLRESE